LWISSILTGIRQRIGLWKLCGRFQSFPYYQLSTNKAILKAMWSMTLEVTVRKKFQELIMNFNLAVGAHALSIDGNKPYTELSLGIDNLGNWELSLSSADYVKSFYNVVMAPSFGLKFFGIDRINMIITAHYFINFSVTTAHYLAQLGPNTNSLDIDIQ
jgi:hypothetical protein